MTSNLAERATARWGRACTSGSGRSGVTIIEYVLMVVLIGVVLIVSTSMLGQRVKTLFSRSNGAPHSSATAGAVTTTTTTTTTTSGTTTGNGHNGNHAHHGGQGNGIGNGNGNGNSGNNGNN